MSHAPKWLKYKCNSIPLSLEVSTVFFYLPHPNTNTLITRVAIWLARLSSPKQTFFKNPTTFQTPMKLKYLIFIIYIKLHAWVSVCVFVQVYEGLSTRRHCTWATVAKDAHPLRFDHDVYPSRLKDVILSTKGEYILINSVIWTVYINYFFTGLRSVY